MQSLVTALIQRLASLRSDFRGSIEFHMADGKLGAIRIVERLSPKDLAAASATA